MSLVTVTVYLHGNDERMWNTGEQLGLTGEALGMFSHACDELELELEVDTSTGLAKVIKIDGRRVVDE